MTGKTSINDLKFAYNRGPTPFQLWKRGVGPRATPKYVYVASSWRNHTQPGVIAALKSLGIPCYDFKNPPAREGFSWRRVDENWMDWTPEQWRAGLKTEAARRGFESDFAGMNDADCCILVLPCGRSAHLEAGYMAAQGKPVFTLALSKEEPDLMTLLLGPPEYLCTSLDELFDQLGVAQG